jgi:hypothetical protein
MDIAAIETDGNGGFQVRFGSDAEGMRLVAGFPTWGSARSWLDDHIRLLSESDPESEAP